MAKVFYVSPGRSYTVTATEGTTITYPGITIPAATVGASGSVTFNCTGTEITVSDDSAQIVQNFNNAGAAVAGAGEGSGGASLEGVALLEGGNSFSGDQNIEGDVVIEGSVTISGYVTAEGEYNGAEVIETSNTTITPEAGKYYKYTGTGDAITVAAPIWNGYMTISYLETTTPVDLQGVTWSPAKPSLAGAGPFVYTLVHAGSGSVLASAMNYSVATAEAIQNVVPMAWNEFTVKPSAGTGNSLAIGNNANSDFHSLAIGSNISATGRGSTAIGRTNETKGLYGLAVGYTNRANASYAVSIGNGCTADHEKSISIGSGCNTRKTRTLTIGSAFTETTPDGNVAHTCITEGTGSITIGAGANTKNSTTIIDGVETTVESSNSITIGCKAENKGTDSVVIGAMSNTLGYGSVVVGSGVKDTERESVAVGRSTKAGAIGVAVGTRAKSGIAGVSVGSNTTSDQYSISVGPNAISIQFGVALGAAANATNNAVALGYYAAASKQKTVAIGYSAKANDIGTTVIRSTAEDGTYTQLYFSGANTPLANTYEDGEAMMGYVVMQKGADGQFAPVAAGTQKLSVLFPNNSTFQPATIDENGEWVMPKVFHPSDLDLPVEEPTEPEDVEINIPEPEPEEYTPLPVYPIVEPEIPLEP